MNAILLIAHGSRSASANHEITELVARLREDAQGFDLIEHAFLEMAEPTIAQAGEKLIAAGARAMVVLPYFLAAGKHTATDVPTEVAQLEARHPKIKITIASHFGAAAGIPSLIHAHLQTANAVA